VSEKHTTALSVWDWLVAGGVGAVLSLVGAIMTVAGAVGVGAMSWVRSQIRESLAAHNAAAEAHPGLIAAHNLDTQAHPVAAAHLKALLEELDEINIRIDGLVRSGHKRANQFGRMQLVIYLIADRLAVQLPPDEDEADTGASGALDVLLLEQHQKRKERRRAAIPQPPGAPEVPA
jgi:hypothetical protein